MIYGKEKNFLDALPDYLIRDLLNYNLWNDTEKIIIKNLYENRNNRKSIDCMIASGILPYAKTQANQHYRNALCKLHKFLQTTESPLYKVLKDILIKP